MPSAAMGEPLGSGLFVVRLLQLLPDSQILARHARNGSGDCRSRFGPGGAARVEKMVVGPI